MNNSQIAIIIGIFATTIALVGIMTFAMPQDEIIPSEKRFLVYTTFYPLQQFTQNIAGDAADVRLLLPSNADPHSFTIGPKTVVELTKADMLVYNGVDFEPFIDEIKSVPDFSHLIFVDSSKGIQLLEGEAHDHDEENHDEGRDEKHEDDHVETEEHDEEIEINHVYDPHIWLDPLLAKKQVMTIANHMAISDPENSEIYLTNAEMYSDQLEALDQEIRAHLSECKNDTFVPFHNAFSYFAERYNIHTFTAIREFSPENPVTANDIEELIHFAEEHDIKYFFTEENRNPKLAERLASELGGDLLLFSPLESLSEHDSPDTTYFDKMRANIDNLKIALECS